MPAFVFDKILSQGVRGGQLPGRTQRARTWFRDAAQKASTSPYEIMKQDPDEGKSRYSGAANVGGLYMFFYDPKHKKTLPYYDRFPLVFPVGGAPGGFMGLNMHYLGYRERAVLMDALYELATNKRYDNSTRLRISYETLKGAAKYKYFKPTLHHYLNGHVKSRFLEVSGSEWDIALFLPVERFEKRGSGAVWEDSRRKAIR